MKLRKYTESQLREAIKCSVSLHQVLSKLGVDSFGGNYITLNKAIKYFDLDISHFTGQAWNKGKKHGPKRTLEDYLSGYPIKSHSLRLRLLSEKIFSHQCSGCSRKNWLKAPIPLELDHIDGNNTNNQLSNLRLLCPNCHARTDTYRGKNQSRRLRSVLPSA